MKGTKPIDGITYEQPFISGTGGSTYFRIPSLATLEDGTLVAAADARWNHTGDGFGVDTMVSRSEDNGKTWKYTFVNYLGDNGNCYDPASTAFLDPAIAVKGNTLYLLTDLYPGGIYIETAVKGTGFDKKGRLMLKRKGSDRYDYYLEQAKNGSGQIADLSGRIVKGWRIDAYFNWYCEKDEQVSLYGSSGNLFFADSPWQVCPTSYLYFIKSEDGGKTWTSPHLLNYAVKRETERFYGVGPGRGLVTKSGRIVFPCYVYDGVNGQRASFIYSDDDGKSWKRSSNCTEEIYSGESQLIELKDQRLRCFFRSNQGRICYVDAKWEKDGYRWQSFVRTEILNCPNCQLSVIALSKEINTRQMILVSCPADKTERRHGKVFAAVVEQDWSMRWIGSLEITKEQEDFAYSCLTEMKDGRVALLYEGGRYPITFYLFEIRRFLEIEK